MSYKSILRKHLKTKQTMFLLCVIFLYILFIGSSFAGFTETYQGNFAAPVCLLALVVVCPLLSAFIEYKSTVDVAAPSVTYYGFKNAADSCHTITAADIAEGDVIYLSRGDISPCSGKILDGEALVSSDGGEAEFFGKSKRTGKKYENYAGNSISQGDVIVSGSLKIEVSDIAKPIDFKEKTTDLTDILFAVSLIMSVTLAAVRLVSGGFPNFIMFGTEVVLDNVAAAAALCMIIPVLGQGDRFLRILFLSKYKPGGIKNSEFPIENCAKTEEICADISYLEQTTGITFFTGNLNIYENADEIPEKIVLAAALNICRNTYNRFGISVNNADMAAAVEFFKMSDYSLPTKIAGAVPYSPEDRFSAVTVRSSGETVTEIFGNIKLFSRCGFYLDEKGATVAIDDELRARIVSKLSEMGSKGIKTRICAEINKKIENSELPEGQFTLIGFIGFATTVPEDNAAAVREMYENGTAVRLISHETAEYNTFLTGLCPNTEVVKSPVFYGENTLAAVNEPDYSENAAIKVSGENASMWAKGRCDLFAESFTDIAKHMNAGRTFAFNRNFCAIMSAFVYMMMWSLLMFQLSVLPVPFADAVIPIISAVAFIWGLLRCNVAWWKIYN
ncbi:MAG: hypothetical protein LBL87_02245 [Ruminococcus sp.]|jgi:magnesium-transporting ATPase (P-type)|nr:hypothetical protein [Ruminococcus sp.]